MIKEKGKKTNLLMLRDQNAAQTTEINPTFSSPSSPTGHRFPKRHERPPLQGHFE